MNHTASTAKRITLQTKTATGNVTKVVGMGALGATVLAQITQQRVSYVECVTFSAEASTADISYGRAAHPDEAYQLLIHNADMLFIVAQAGNPEAMRLAVLARALGVLTIAVLAQGNDEAADLSSCVADKTITVTTEKLAEVVQQAIQGMVYSVQQAGLVNLDLDNMRDLMQGGGVAQVSSGQAIGATRALQASKQALQSEMRDVQNALITLTSTDTILLSELEIVMSTVAQAHPNALLVVASVFDEGMDDVLRVTLIRSANSIT